MVYRETSPAFIVYRLWTYKAECFTRFVRIMARQKGSLWNGANLLHLNIFMFFLWVIFGLFFSSIFIFSTIQLIIGTYKICRWQDLNRRTPVSEAAAIPSEPQPLPNILNGNSVSRLIDYFFNVRPFILI